MLNHSSAIPHVAHMNYDCPWCWRVLYPATPFPVGQPSKLCAGHYNWLLAQLKAWYSQGKETRPV